MSGELSTSSYMATPTEEDLVAMEKFMSDGKRNYFCNQPQVALDCFVQLCEKLSKYYGQESDKCMEAYLYYGKTLLEIARLESGVFGQAIKDSTPVSDDSDVEEIGCSTKESKIHLTDEKKDNAPPLNLKSQSEEKQAMVHQDNDNPDKDNGTNCSAEGNGKAFQQIKDISENVFDGEESDEDETEDVTNMELAWEMFELTAVICKRQLDNEEKEQSKKEKDKKEKDDTKNIVFMLAEARNGLAQVSLETEQYEEAVRDFTDALHLYQETLDNSNDRVIAETHYNIALALSFDKKFGEAIEHFEQAASVLRAKVEDLEGKIKESEDKGGKTEKPSPEVDEWKKEINDLNDLIQHEMMTRIEDAQESKRLLDESIKTVKTAASEMFSSFGTTNTFDEGFEDSTGFDSSFGTNDQVVVNDCTDKIRSLKRKNEDVVPGVVVKK